MGKAFEVVFGEQPQLVRHDERRGIDERNEPDPERFGFGAHELQLRVALVRRYFSTHLPNSRARAMPLRDS